MALLSRTEVGLRATGTSVNVPDNPKAKLMYYLNSICSVLELDDNQDINRLRRYNDYWTLSRSDTRLLISLCLLLKPDVLLNKCIFQDDGMCGDSSNEFYSIEAVSNHLMVAGSIMIGGQRKRVTEIMTFKMSWLRNNWIQPMEALSQQLEEREAIQRRQESSDSCVII